MSKYIVHRILQAIPQLLIISFILFALMQSFGDPLATIGQRRPQHPEEQIRLRRQLGLEQPILVQYVVWLVGNDWMQIDLDGDGSSDRFGTRKGALRGDWGVSLVTRTSARKLIAERLPNTLLLMLPAEALIISLSLGIGIYSALNQYSFFDYAATTASILGYSMPVFWLALMLIYIFAVRFMEWGLPYLPTGGVYDPAVGRTLGEIVRHMVLPVATITLISVAGLSRHVRASVLEVLGEHYLALARAKGLPESKVIMGHALRNSLLPFVTLVGLDLPFLLGGAVVTETIFSWPGMGRLFIDHLARADFPVLMGILMLISVSVVAFQIATDIAYAALDPRIHFNV